MVKCPEPRTEPEGTYDLFLSSPPISTLALGPVHQPQVFHSQPLLTISSATILVQDPVVSCLGYSNSLLAGFPVHIDSLQFILHTAT